MASTTKSGGSGSGNSGKGSGGGSGRKHTVRCSFCGKTDNQVGPMIEGPGNITICSECVDLCSTIIRQEKKRSTRATTPGVTKSSTPKEIKEHLDQYVVGQELAKKSLAVAVYNHYKRLSYMATRKAGQDDVEIEKSNVLMIGPTGCGKTLLARTLASFLQVPFAITDATTLTEAGYVGEDVENILLRLLQAAEYDIDLAQQGIIYVDEIDKIGKTNQNVSITRDVSGEGVQQSLLKILEGTVSNIPPQGGRKHPEQQYIQLDTSNILFICGGTFAGLDQIVKKRLGRKMIGFGSEQAPVSETTSEEADILKHATPEDLVHYGMIPELVGRLPAITALEPLDTDALVKILVEPKNSLIRQYQKFFELEQAELVFTDEALQAIAAKALRRDTGARALRAVVEELMLELMFILPEQAPGGRYEVTPEVVDGKTNLFDTQQQSDETPARKDSA